MVEAFYVKVMCGCGSRSALLPVRAGCNYKIGIEFCIGESESKFGVPFWEIKEHFLVGDHPHRKFG